MENPITLSTGEIVYLRPWKRKVQKLFSQTLKQGVNYRRDLDTGAMDPVEEIPAVNFDLAYEAALGLLVEKIERNGTEIPFSEAWKDDLEPADYDRLERAVYELKEASKAAGEKNPEPTA